MLIILPYGIEYKKYVNLPLFCGSLKIHGIHLHVLGLANVVHDLVKLDCNVDQCDVMLRSTMKKDIQRAANSLRFVLHWRKGPEDEAIPG